MYAPEALARKTLSFLLRQIDAVVRILDRKPDDDRLLEYLLLLQYEVRWRLGLDMEEGMLEEDDVDFDYGDLLPPTDFEGLFTPSNNLINT